MICNIRTFDLCYWFEYLRNYLNLRWGYQFDSGVIRNFGGVIISTIQEVIRTFDGVITKTFYEVIRTFDWVISRTMCGGYQNFCKIISTSMYWVIIFFDKVISRAIIGVIRLFVALSDQFSSSVGQLIGLSYFLMRFSVKQFMGLFMDLSELQMG